MMTAAGNTFELVRRAALPALAVLIIVNFLGYAVVGSNGLLSLGDYRRLKSEKTIELAQLSEERVNSRARRYLRDLRRDAVIEFR